MTESTSRRAKGEGGLHQVTKNGRLLWKGTVYVTIGGKAVEKTCTDEKKTIAARKLRELREKWGKIQNPTNETVAEYLDWWIEYQRDAVQKGQKDQDTVDDYVNSFRYVKASDVGTVPLVDLNAGHIFELLRHLADHGRPYYKNGKVVGHGPLARRTIVRIPKHLEMALTTATTLGKVPINVAKLVEIPHTVDPVPKRALTGEQAELVLATAEKRANERPGDVMVHAFLMLGLVGGLRVGENLGAQWDKLEWEFVTEDGQRFLTEDGQVCGALRIEQTLKEKKACVRANGERTPGRRVMGDVKRKIQASRRIMLLPPEVLQVLRRWQVEQKRQQLATRAAWHNEHNLIFTSEIGTPIPQNNMTVRVNRVIKTADLGHWALSELTRHSFATFLDELEPQAHNKAMGHQPHSTVGNRYIHTDLPVVSSHLDRMGRIIKNKKGQD